MNAQVLSHVAVSCVFDVLCARAVNVVYWKPMNWNVSFAAR